MKLLQFFALVALAGGARSDVSLSVEERAAARAEAAWAQGDCKVVESALFAGGVRLEAFDLPQGGDPAIAVAIYQFRVPPASKRLRLTVVYESHTGEGQRGEIAGSVWVSGELLPINAVPKEARGTMYVLPVDAARAEFEFDAPPSTAQGFAEIHLVASAGHVLDVAWLRLETFDTGGRYIVSRPTTPLLHLQPYELTACTYYGSPWFYLSQPATYVAILPAHTATEEDKPSPSATPPREPPKRKIVLRAAELVKPAPVKPVPIHPVNFPPVPVKPAPVSSLPIKPIEVKSPDVKPAPVAPAPVSPVPTRPIEVNAPDVKPAPVKPAPVRGFSSE